MTEKFKKETKFKTYWYHRKLPYWFRKDRDRNADVREFPEVVRLDVAPGVTPSDGPPVRIFVGTESPQYRAERVFVWSISQVRDPARAYEIYLMKDLKGFDRDGWKTGFSNYRYAIPTLVNGVGRAIYNDVDQIYLSDPAELFDTNMGGAGILGITERETSVMLIDCEKMIRFWNIDEARSDKRHKHFRAITHGNGLWAPLPREWNARDDEFSAAQSKCFHFTILQTQPWRPFPDQLRYRPHPDGDVWLALERDADAAGFTPFTKERPSRRFGELLSQYRIMHRDGETSEEGPSREAFTGKSLRQNITKIAQLVRHTKAKTILDYGAGKAKFYDAYPGESQGSRFRSHAAWPGVKVVCYDPGYKPFAEPFEESCDGVICTDVLEHIPEEDIAWVLDEIFGAARQFIYLVAACYPARKILPNGENAHCTLAPPDWWHGEVELAARRHPGIRWVLVCKEKTQFGKKRRTFEGIGLLTQAA